MLTNRNQTLNYYSRCFIPKRVTSYRAPSSQPNTETTESAFILPVRNEKTHYWQDTARRPRKSSYMAESQLFATLCQTLMAWNLNSRSKAQEARAFTLANSRDDYPNHTFKN